VEEGTEWSLEDFDEQRLSNFNMCDVVTFSKQLCSRYNAEYHAA
jgi:hypothetical protein